MAKFPLVVQPHRVAELRASLITHPHGGSSSRFLMGRTLVGIPLRRMIEDRLSTPSSPTTHVLDFGGVEDISASVAEELGPILVRAVMARSRPGSEQYVVYAGLTDDVRLGLDDELKRTGVVVAAVGATIRPASISGRQFGLDLLGPDVSRPVREVVDRIYAEYPLTSSALEVQSSVAASKRLADVVDKVPGVIHRDKVYGRKGTRSWEWVYYPLVPDSLTVGSLNAYSIPPQEKSEKAG